MLPAVYYHRQGNLRGPAYQGGDLTAGLYARTAVEVRVAYAATDMSRGLTYGARAIQYTSECFLPSSRRKLTVQSVDVVGVEMVAVDAGQPHDDLQVPGHGAAAAHELAAVDGSALGRRVARLEEAGRRGGGQVEDGIENGIEDGYQAGGWAGRGHGGQKQRDDAVKEMAARHFLRWLAARLVQCESPRVVGAQWFFGPAATIVLLVLRTPTY